jgi:hypothetical protein
LKKLNVKTAQAAINKEPPIGVTIPIALKSIPVTALVDSK